LPPPPLPRRPQAQPLLAGEPKSNTAEADIALAFQQSALKSTAEGDALFAAMTLRWMPADLAGQPEGEGGAPVWHPARCASVTVPRCDAWDGLFLECAVEWPLQLLFPPEVGVCGVGCQPASQPCMLHVHGLQRAVLLLMCPFPSTLSLMPLAARRC
jgi:hypothetical protein